MKKILTAAVCAAMVAGTLPAAGAVDAAAKPTGNTIYVDGVQVNGAAYMINNNNYFKLRDIAAMVNGSAKQFEVSWNSTEKRIDLTTGTAYTPVGGELALPGGAATAKQSTAAVFRNGSRAGYTGYSIAGNNYYKLRDLCRDMNIGVKFDTAAKRVDIVTTEGYTEDSGTVTAPAAAITKWNSTMRDFNEDMINCNWNQSKYLEVAKKYGAAITGKTNATTADVVAALEAMTGAPVDAVSFDDNPVNLFWAKELRKAMGEIVEDNNNQTVAVSDETLRQWESEMIELINEERAKVGAPALTVDTYEMQFAQYWAKHLTTEFKHSNIDEKREFCASIGISYRDIEGGENITTADSIKDATIKKPSIRAMELFMASEGHRNTLLDKEYTRVGVGFAVGPTGRVYCCQRFGV